MNVSGSVVLVFGGANGLGEATVREMVRRGARVGIADLPDSPGPALAGELGSDALFLPVDVRDEDAVDGCFDRVIDAWGAVHVSVNTAGIATAHRLMSRSGTRFPPELFRRTIDINLIGVFNVVRAAARGFASNEPGESGERGVVVNVASIAAFDGQKGQAAYSASKAAVAGMCLPLARDLAGLGVRVATIAPGIMGTRMLFDAPEDLQASLVAEHVFPKRPGRPEEFAALVCAIVENPLINGETIRLDAAARLSPG